MDRDSAVAWSQATLPTRYTAIRFRWKYQDDQKRWGGRGQARIAPPDSLRFDYVGPLGLGAGAAAIVADSALWADPEKNFRSLIPAVRMLWAALGIVRPPAPEARVFGGGSADSSVLLRRFAQDGDTLDYRETRGGARVLEAEWRSEEHTSELQSHVNLVCRLLLEKKKQDHHLQQALKRPVDHLPDKLGSHLQHDHRP